MSADHVHMLKGSSIHALALDGIGCGHHAIALVCQSASASPRCLPTAGQVAASASHTTGVVLVVHHCRLQPPMSLVAPSPSPQRAAGPAQLLNHRACVLLMLKLRLNTVLQLLLQAYAFLVGSHVAPGSNRLVPPYAIFTTSFLASCVQA